MTPRAALAVLLLAALLAACSGDSQPPHDVPGVDAAPDVPPAMDVPSARDMPAVDRGVEDAAAPRDVAPDLAPDVPPEDHVDAAPDVPPDMPQPVDAAPDRPDPCGSPVLRQCDIDGLANCVDIQGGRMRPDGTTLHCGRCGNTCVAGMRCSLGNCITL